MTKILEVKLTDRGPEVYYEIPGLMDDWGDTVVHGYVEPWQGGWTAWADVTSKVHPSVPVAIYHSLYGEINCNENVPSDGMFVFSWRGQRYAIQTCTPWPALWEVYEDRYVLYGAEK